MRTTKIVATLGPASDPPGVLRQMFQAGVDVFRLNASHGVQEDHARRLRAVRELAAELKVHVGILMDLQGPKIRIARFRAGKVILQQGQAFVLDTGLKADAGDERQVGVTYKALATDVKAGDTLLLDDGRIVLKVLKVVGNEIRTEVIAGGVLSNNQGLNREGGGLTAKALTTKDRKDLVHALALGADYIAISFPRDANDIQIARRLITKAGGKAGIIAKIERAEALDHIAEIIDAADGIMVARGDLGVEIGDSRLPPVQKALIKRARRHHRFVITATQMMDSMIESPLPTRAEVFDVANAVLDGTDAVMLSAETSVGKYPDRAVEAMARICIEAEKQWTEYEPDSMLDREFDRVDQAIAMSSIYCANRIGVAAIAALTESGSVTRWMSRIDTDIPIFALSRHVATLRRVTLYRGVYPIAIDVGKVPVTEVTRAVLTRLKGPANLKSGDRVILTKGDLDGRSGGTNGMKIVTVGDFIQHVA